MSTLDNAPIQCSYTAAGATVTFPTETETLGVESRPRFDSAGRAVVYVEHLLHLKATIATANQALGRTTDSALAQMRQTLTSPAGILRYANVGFGNLVINANVVPYDCVWGPKPELLRWRPQGFSQAAEVEWQVRARIPECPTPRYKFALMEFCFRTEFDTDESGYTTRRYVAHFSIPQTRATPTTRTLSDSADALGRYFELLVPALLPGFRRVVGPRTVSEDKCRVDMTITDRLEGPNYPPPGVVSCTARHTSHTDGVFGGKSVGTLSATYEVSRDRDLGAVAFPAFAALLTDRLARVKAGGSTRPDGVRLPSVPIIRSLNVEEPEIYGKKKAAFSATYSYLMGLRDILRTSGMWSPVPGNNWALWAASLANTAFHPRGAARLSVEANQDAIIDLCAQAAAVPMVPRLIPVPGAPVVGNVKQNYPDPAFSWLYYVCWLVIYPRDQVAEIKALPGGTPPSNGPGGILSGFPTQGGNLLSGVGGPATPGAARRGGANLVSGLGGGGPSGGGTLLSGIGGPAGELDGGDNPLITGYLESDFPNSASIVQVRTNPRWEAVLYGHAERAGFPIAPPALLTVAGQPAIPANRRGDGFAHVLAASWFGVPVFRAWWRLRYILPDVPAGELPVPDNPFVGF